MKNKIYVGIDPGKNGGIAAIDSNCNIILTSVMPLIVEELNSVELINLISFDDYDVKIALEDVHSIYGSSAKSNFEFGRILGGIESSLKVLRKPYVKVQPKIWQKVSFQGIQKMENPKDMALLASNRLFPNESFIMTQRSKKPHDGVIDASLIAYWAKVSNL